MAAEVTVEAAAAAEPEPAEERHQTAPEAAAVPMAKAVEVAQATTAAQPAAEAEAAPAADVEPASPPPWTQTAVLIAEIPGFSRALGLQRAIQGVEGVREAKAIGYEKGVLSLEVTHEPDQELLNQLLALPGYRLRVLRADPESIELVSVNA